MADSLLGVIGDQTFELGLSVFVLKVGRPSPRKDPRKLRPGVGGTQVDDAHRLDPRLRRFDAEQGRGLAILDAAPEFPFGGNDEVLVERIGMGLDLDPFPAPGNHRKHRTSGSHNPHIMLQLGHVFFDGRLLRNDHGNMNLLQTHHLRHDRRGSPPSREGSDGGPTAGRP